MAKKRIKFMCTAFRDGFQSAFGARVFTDDFIPAVEAARDAGITWFEAGGGARFQSLYFYCNEDAFTMMDRFRAAAGEEANLQTLARGVNVVGLDSQSGDVIDLHARLFKKHGITTIRNFDALNDVNNLIYSGKCIVEAGLHHQVCVTLMELPPGCAGAHDAEFYEKTLRAILDSDLPFDSVCFKDASGTAVPSKVYETIKRARKMLPADALIHFHTHETAGISVLGYQAALDAGADAIDLSLAPTSGGTCQPDILVMWHALRGTNYDLGIDVDKVREAEAVFKDCMKDYFVPPEALAVEPMIPWSPMPGGALTANTQMLRDNGIMNKYEEIIGAMSEVVRKGGFGTSVTPVSQFYFQQAFNNVMFGTWEKIAPTYGKMVLGYFGKTPVAPDPEIVKLASEQLGLEPTTESPLVLNDADPEKGLAPARALLEGENLPTTEENLFIAATCKDKGIDFLKGEATVGVRKKEKENAPKPEKESTPAPAVSTNSGDTPTAYAVTVNGETFTVELGADNAIINGQTYAVGVSATSSSGAAVAAAPVVAALPSGGDPVASPLPGKVLRLVAAAGKPVSEGEVLLVLEAMKMETEIKATKSGTLTRFAVGKGTQVNAGEPLAYIAS